MRAGRRDGGQATVELALVLPLVAVLALGLVQVAVVGYRQVLVVHAAREGARAAAVAPGDEQAAARRGVDRAGGLDVDRVRVHTSIEGDVVAVQVSYRDDTDIPLVGLLIPPADLTAVTRMRREGP